MEKFCCRFKTLEIATSFKDAFMKAKAIVKENEEKLEKQQVMPPVLFAYLYFSLFF